ncbi:hypothetical protein Q8A73_002969 [Channa argus]|nr:hypothetical protein Q8A73_002969 [Channa argus]
MAHLECVDLPAELLPFPTISQPVVRFKGQLRRVKPECQDKVDTAAVINVVCAEVVCVAVIITAEDRYRVCVRVWAWRLVPLLSDLTALNPFHYSCHGFSSSPTSPPFYSFHFFRPLTPELCGSKGGPRQQNVLVHPYVLNLLRGGRREREGRAARSHYCRPRSRLAAEDASPSVHRVNSF